MSLAETHPKYIDLWPVYQNQPFPRGSKRVATVIRKEDSVFQAWAPAPGNMTPSWTYVSTPLINCGTFIVPAGGWFDAGDHPNPEPYYILEGTLHLSNPDTSDVIELHAGDASNIPAQAFHHGYNFGEEDCLILWWVPGEMHTDLFKQKAQDGTLLELGWYERSAVVLNGPHDRNEGFESRIDQLAQWPNDAAKTDVDMVRIDRRRWLHLLHGDNPREAALKSFFYADDTIRCGELVLPRNRSAQSDSLPWEQVLYVTQGTIGVNMEGSAVTLKAEPGDAIFIPANERHTFMALGSTGARAAFGMARA
jgi:quercetin dioxygenase-like cupin family protein